MDVLGFEERGRQPGWLSSRRTEEVRADRGGPNPLNSRDGVMPGRPAGCTARLGKTASLPGAMRRSLRAFQAS